MTDNQTDSLTSADAETIVESLRMGVPPTGHVRAFTVGRKAELKALEATMHSASDRGSARLIRANYGGGKSHLLRVIREMALESGYAISLVTLDANGGVRGNRMDQVFGAVCRNIEVPGVVGPGISGLFDAFAESTSATPGGDLRDRISASGSWRLSEYLQAPAMFVALRAWVTSSSRSRRDIIADWLNSPENYEATRRKFLYEQLVIFSGRPFRDPRPEAAFYQGILQFRPQDYTQCWSGLRDLHEIARAAGLRGLILLVDEFEDVIQNLNNRNYQQAAFANLFRIFDGERFPGTAYFGVTPEFSHKCKWELLSRGVYSFPTSRFDELEHFEMSPVSKADLKRLARTIREVHALAYGSDADEQLSDEELDAHVDKLVRRSTQDQTRQAIEGIVEALDEALEG